MIRRYRWRALLASWFLAPALGGIAVLSYAFLAMLEAFPQSDIPGTVYRIVEIFCGVGAAIGVVGAVLVVVIAVYTTVAFLVSPHPAHHYLEAYGPPAGLLGELERELAGTEDVLTIERADGDAPRWLNRLFSPCPGDVLITPSWVLQIASVNDIPAVRLDDVLWARWLPGGLFRPPSVEVGGRLARAVTFTLDKKTADHFLRKIIRRLPWVLNGLEERWQRDGEPDWAGISAEVERRRQEHMARPAVPKEAPKPT
jgi:hypothetical protein